MENKIFKEESRKEIWTEYNHRSEVIKKRKEYYSRLEVKERIREYQIANKEVIAKRTKEYIIKNKDIISQKHKEYTQKPEVKKRDILYRKEYNAKLEIKERKKKWNDRYMKEYIKKPEVKERIREYKKLYIRNRRKKDVEFLTKERLKTRLRCALKYYLKNNKHSISRNELIDYKSIIKYLKPFPENIKDYHIDHIKPLCTFDFTKEEEIKKAFSPENHQWLLIKENLNKGGKWKDEN